MSRWRQVQARRLFRVVNGGTPTSDPDNWDGSVPWATPIDLGRRNGGVLTGTERTLTDRGLQTGSATVPAGSLIVSTRAPIGYVVETRAPTAFNQGCRGLAPHVPLHVRFYRYVVEALVSQLQAAGQGSTFVELSGSQLGDQRLPNPPVVDQRAIADFLDTETARIDALIAKKRHMVGLLGDRWRTDVRYNMHLLGHRHGTIPLKRLVTCLDGRRVPLSAEERGVRRGEYPYFGASGQIDTVDSYLFDETLVLLGEDGAQLADPDYEISIVVSGRVWVNNHAHVLRPRLVDPWFLAMHLSTVDRSLVISGATREKITQADMNRIPVPDLTLEMQREVSARLRTKRSILDGLAGRLQDQIQLLQEHRQALITAAVTGQMEVPGVAA